MQQVNNVISFQTMRDITLPDGTQVREKVSPFLDALGARRPAYKKMWTPWLQAVARNTIQDMAVKDQSEIFVNEARSRTIMVLMGGNLVNAMQNYSSYPIIIDEIGAAAMADGLKEYLRDRKGSTAFAMQKSGEMQTRYDNLERDTREIINSIRQGGTRVQRGLDNVRQIAFWFQNVTDKSISVPAWIGAYRKAIAPKEKGGMGLPEGDAIYYADRVVRTTIASGGIKDTSAVQRGSTINRVVTMLYGYMGMVYNRNRSSFLNWRDGEISGLEFATSQVMINLLPNLIAAMIVDGVTSGGASDDEDWYMWYLSRILSGYFGLVPFVRDIGGAANQAFFNGQFGDKVAFSPIGSTIGGIGRGVFNILTAAGNGDDQWDKIVGDAINGAAWALKVPPGFIKNPARYVADWLEGDQDPETPLDVVRGLAAGPQRQSR